MQTYLVELKSDVFKSFRCQKAANSLDIDVEKKSIHRLEASVDLTTPYSVGLILGASGSGKTTLAKKMFGDDIFNIKLDESKPIIEQLPAELSYDDCAALLSGIGLTSVPCWIRPVCTLSNGQKARAEAAFLMANSASNVVVLDEWTSVVDRTVAKVMSHCVQKFARKFNKRVILLSCHYDVQEWLNPDFIFDCNTQQYIDRRLLRPDERARTEKLQFDIKEVDSKSWRYFSKYHYLSDKLPGGGNLYYGLFHNDLQIGFQCFANYVPHKKNTIKIYHSNRTVIHPDYAGLGLGIHLINETSHIMHKKGYKVMAKFSSVPVYKAMSKQKCWVCVDSKSQIGPPLVGGLMINKEGQRKNVKYFSFLFVGNTK